MAQIIKHRRGNAEELGSTTLYKGEMGVTTGSNVAGGLANPIVHIGDGANAGGFVVGRLQYGTSTPNISSGYNATLNDILFYNQHNNKLERLHQSGNETLDLFGNLTSGTISGSVEITGMISASGGITASDIWASGDIHAVGNITFEAGAGGTITLGDSAADNVVFGADVQSSIIPNASDSYDLGSTGQRWNNLWMSGSLTANGGPHSILSATTIDVDAEGALTLDGGSITIGGDADVAIDMDASTFDVDASGALTMTSTTMAFDPSSTFDIDAAGAVTIDGSAITIGGDSDVAVDIDSSTLDIDASGAITIDGTSTILISGDGGATFSDDTEALVYDGSGNVDFDSVALDIDSSGAITIDGTSTVSIDGADDMNFTITSGTAGEDLTIAQLGANDSSIFIAAAGTGADAISIDATAGSMLVAPSLIDGKTLKIGRNGAVEMVFTPHGTASNEKWSLINTAGNATDAIAVTATAGGIDIGAGTVLALDGAGGIDIGKAADVAMDIDAAALDIDASGALTIDSATSISIGTTADKPIDIDATTFDLDAAGALTLDSATSISIGATADKPIDIDSTTLDIDASGAVTIDTSAGGVSIDAAAASNFSTAAGALLLHGAGGINIGTTADVAIDVDAAAFDLDASGALNIDSATSVSLGIANSGIAVSIGHTTSETTINDNLTVIGNLNVTGTETIVDSNVVNISDNIIQVNTGGAKRKGGLQVIDTDGDQTGSVVWDSDGNYFEVGLSGSEYRLPELSTSTELSGNNNRVLISDGARIDASAAITDDGSTVDISNRVDAQASLQVTGSLYVSAGASVAASLASLVSFRNNGSTQLGYLASANTSAVTTGLVGYNASTGNLTISSVIDGGSF